MSNSTNKWQVTEALDPFLRMDDTEYGPGPLYYKDWLDCERNRWRYKTSADTWIEQVGKHGRIAMFTDWDGYKPVSPLTPDEVNAV